MVSLADTVPAGVFLNPLTLAQSSLRPVGMSATGVALGGAATRRVRAGPAQLSSGFDAHSISRTDFTVSRCFCAGGISPTRWLRPETGRPVETVSVGRIVNRAGGRPGARFGLPASVLITCERIEEMGDSGYCHALILWAKYSRLLNCGIIVI
jgi:hypothetical protein